MPLFLLNAGLQNIHLQLQLTKRPKYIEDLQDSEVPINGEVPLHLTKLPSGTVE